MTLLQHQLLVCGDEREEGRREGEREREGGGGGRGREREGGRELSSRVFLPPVGILCDNYVGDASHLLSLLVMDQQWKELESLFQ